MGKVIKIRAELNDIKTTKKKINEVRGDSLKKINKMPTALSQKYNKSC